MKDNCKMPLLFL